MRMMGAVTASKARKPPLGFQISFYVQTKVFFERQKCIPGSPRTTYDMINFVYGHRKGAYEAKGRQRVLTQWCKVCWCLLNWCSHSPLWRAWRSRAKTPRCRSWRAWLTLLHRASASWWCSPPARCPPRRWVRWSHLRERSGKKKEQVRRREDFTCRTEIEQLIYVVRKC